jgi:putative FmdB family regulatory protein
MPIYEYRCEKCGRSFEKLKKFQDKDRDVQCPYCESEEVERILSSFAQGGGCGAPAGSRFR